MRQRRRAESVRRNATAEGRGISLTLEGLVGSAFHALLGDCFSLCELEGSARARSERVLLLGGLLCVPLDGAQEALLERARAAPGATAAAPQLEGRGKARDSGVDGALRVVLATDGRFYIDFDAPLPERTAFDGSTTWTRDHMGLERRLELEDADRAKLFAWVLSGYWSTANEVALEVMESAAGVPPRFELTLRGTPLTMVLALDAATLLPAELGYVDDSGPVSWKFSDYREVAGRRLPHRWVFDEGAGPETSADRFEIEEWKSVPGDAAVFHAEFARPEDVSFTEEIEPELEVQRVASGHLLVEPWVEGESVGWFIFDTGAGAMTIDPAVADELGMPELGEIVAVGVGGRTTTSFRRGTRFELGPLALEDPVYVELDLAFLEPLFGRKVAGIVGFDVLARCVAEIETRTPYVALHDPARFQLEGASWQDLTIAENTPSVRARFEGDHEGLFRIDTGANGTVSFHAPAVRALALLDGRTVTSGASGGVGGAAETRDGRLAWFELAGHRFEKRQVQFSLAERGAFTDLYTVGNIGQEFLAPFRLVLDYPGDRIAFVRLGK